MSIYINIIYRNDTEKGFGTLTQRLVSCLIEEQQLNESLETDTDIKKSANLFKGLSFGNIMQFEKRIKKELEENGILDPDDVILNDSCDDDEILRELLRCQNELKTISTQNQSQLKALLNHAKADISKQEVKKKLVVADNDVSEIYRRFTQTKQKKKLPSKKEKEQATKALRERDAIVRQLEKI